MEKENWKYWLSPKAVFQMTEESQAMYPQETGGILIGWKDGNTFYIEIAIGPGPKAIHKRSRFTRDGDFSQTQLDEIVVETADQWDYIGEWHSHPRKMGPSVKDLNSLRKIQMDSSYNMGVTLKKAPKQPEVSWRKCKNPVERQNSSAKRGRMG